MPVFQTNTWVCENCEKCSSVTEFTSPYSDPVVCPPRGEEWEYKEVDKKELLCCPTCLTELGN